MPQHFERCPEHRADAASDQCKARGPEVLVERQNSCQSEARYQYCNACKHQPDVADITALDPTHDGNADQSVGDRGQGRKHPFGFPCFSQYPARNEILIEPSADSHTRFHAWRAARRRADIEQEPRMNGKQQRRKPCRQPCTTAKDDHNNAYQIDDGDALQHAGPAYHVGIECWSDEPTQAHTDQKQQQRSPDDGSPADDRPRAVERQRCRQTDDQQKDGKYEIGERQPVPFGMFEHGKGGISIALNIDQYHQQYIDTAKAVERLIALWLYSAHKTANGPRSSLTNSYRSPR